MKTTWITPEEVIGRILAGEIFTIVNTNTREHICYKTTKHEDYTSLEAKTAGNKYFDFGSILGNHDLVCIQSLEATLFTRFWNGLLNKAIPVNLALWNPFPCLKCKRLLTDPYSIEHGAGPTCKKTHSVRNAVQSEFISY